MPSVNLGDGALTHPKPDNAAVQQDHRRRMNENSQESQEYWLGIMHRRYPEYVKLLQRYKSSGVLLDIGCGFANVWYEEYIKPRGYRYYCTDMGQDVINHMTSVLSSRGNETCAKQGTLENIPWPDQMFDIVYASHILEHSTDIGKAFSEIKRVLKPDGILLFAVPCGYDDEPAHTHNREYEEWKVDFENNRMFILESGRFSFNQFEFYGIVRPT